MNIETYIFDDDCYMKGYIHTPYQNSQQHQYPALLLVPGGGFKQIPDAEAERICLAFVNKGYNAFYLHYHLDNGHQPLMPRPVYDLARAMVVLREKAETYYLNGNITLMGLSIGGEIVSQYNGSFFLPEFQHKIQASEDVLCPDQIILGYGVTSFEDGFPKTKEQEQTMIHSLEEANSCMKVQSKSRPCFIWATWDDPVVPVQNSLHYAQALREKNIPCELHLFDKGPHGLGLATKQTTAYDDYHIAHWFDLCCEWLERQ